jgi:hypothetical protein
VIDLTQDASDNEMVTERIPATPAPENERPSSPVPPSPPKLSRSGFLEPLPMDLTTPHIAQRDHKLRNMYHWHESAVLNYILQYHRSMSQDDLWVIFHLFPIHWDSVNPASLFRLYEPEQRFFTYCKTYLSKQAQNKIRKIIFSRLDGLNLKV